MNDIEQKALALVNEIEHERGEDELTPRIMRGLIIDEALCRAIERHEVFAQEVSDAVFEFYGGYRNARREELLQFIIAKPDPLVEAIAEAFKRESGDSEAINLTQAIAKRDGKIVWGQGE